MTPLRSLLVRVGLGAVSGLALVPAFPPVDQRWVACLALVPLLVALRDASWRQGMVAGLAFGWAFFGVLLQWISAFGFLAWGALTLALAAYTGALGALGAVAARAGIAGRVLGIPLLWGSIELMRGRMPLGGFTWGDLGASQHTGGSLLPVARIGGVYLLGVVLVAVNALVADALAGASRARRWCAASAAVLVLAPGLLPVGLAGARTGSMEVAAVQGNVPRGHFTGLGRTGGRTGPEDVVIVQNHIRVTERLVGAPPPDLVVWPENAFDRDPQEWPDLFEPVRGLARRIGSPFLIGAILGGRDTFRNTALLLDDTGTIRSVYDKVHLVPFGEYVPWQFARDLVPALDQEIPVDGTPGAGVEVFDTPAGRVGPVICFESTFPELVRASVREGAQVVVVMTNNASYGTSPAAAQHLAMSRMRAIEHGRPVVHAAISGISAIIAPDGTVLSRAGLFTPALLRAEVPLTDGRTPYTRYGAIIEMAMVVGAAGAVAIGLVASRRRRA